MKTILISACLLGKKVRFDGRIMIVNDSILRFLRKMQKRPDKINLIPFCPEVAGGLEIPRPPAEIQGGSGMDVLDQMILIKNIKGRDVTDFFITGARLALKKAIQKNVEFVILKEKSPSCGSTAVYDGSFSRRLIPGEGVAAALLRAHGIKIFSENEIELALDLALQ